MSTEPGTTHAILKAGDGLVVGAVRCEPVSGGDFPVLQGVYREFRSLIELRPPFQIQIGVLKHMLEIGFEAESEQGILRGEQGSRPRDQGTAVGMSIDRCRFDRSRCPSECNFPVVRLPEDQLSS